MVSRKGKERQTSPTTGRMEAQRKRRRVKSPIMTEKDEKSREEPPIMTGGDEKSRELEPPTTIMDVDIASAVVDEVVRKLQVLPKTDLGKTILDVTTRCNAFDDTFSQFNMERTSLKSISATKWFTIAKKYGFNLVAPEDRDFKAVKIPTYCLPPLIHEKMFEASWHTRDVYREPEKQTREEARVRTMEPYLVHIMSLFEGRIIDQPEAAMLPTKCATGGAVEHEILMIGGFFCHVEEFKLEVNPANLAQLFCELLAAAEANKNTAFSELRVYGLLTDLHTFTFYSYDPKKNEFAFDERLSVLEEPRDMALKQMIPVCNKIFSTILTAYIESLQVMTSKSLESQGLSLDSDIPLKRVLSFKTASEPGLSKYGDGSEKKNKWELALDHAQSCCHKFMTTFKTIDDIEENSTAALTFLAKSVQCIPRFDTLNSSKDPSSIDELREFARTMVLQAHLDMLENK